MKKALIIFTRVPEPGKTKTRLQSLLTEEEAAKVHEAMLKDQKRLCVSDEWDTFVYYTPERGKERIKQLLLQAKDYIPQQEVEFGMRMKNCIQHVLESGYDACCLIGTDIPALDEMTIRQAFETLEKKQVVIGGTEDLGYYLIGMTQIYDGIFENQIYGTGSVYEDTIEKIKKCGCSYGTLPKLRDIDEPEDLKAYYFEYSENHKMIEHTWEYLKKLDEKYDFKTRKGM